MHDRSDARGDAARRLRLLRVGAALLATTLLAGASATHGASPPLPLSVPVTLDYALVERALTEHVFVEPGQRARVLGTPDSCNELVAARPRVAAAEDGRLRVLLDLEARGGTPLGTRCVLPFSWRGEIELFESARFGEVPTRLEFHVTDSRLAASTDAAATVPAVLWNWVKQFVHPRIEAVGIDLAPLIDDARRLLDGALAAAPEARAMARESLALHTPVARATGLEITLGADLPGEAPGAAPTAAAPPVTPAELRAWDTRWQAWDAFFTWTIKTLAPGADDALRHALLEVLEQARYALRDALVVDSPAPDPVRDLFLESWPRLAPLVGRAARDGDTGMALRYLAFVSAGDLLGSLDRLGRHLGVRIDRNGLREIARTLVSDVDDGELAYDTAPDPELRALYGLPPILPDSAAGALPARAARQSWTAWLIAPAHAAAAPAPDLDAWLPRAGALDDYLARMDSLFDEVIAAEEQRGKIAARFLPVYRRLVRATAWQESCWRQYVEQAGTVEPIRSQAGSVGLMQVNKHVWRGIYDLERLEREVAYNAHAGNEILVHYLLDYAIRKGEHEVTGDIDALARATYAAYNGGPGHLKRYRQPDTRGHLRAIDEAFWRKYQAIGDHGAQAVRACYGD